MKLSFSCVRRTSARISHISRIARIARIGGVAVCALAIGAGSSAPSWAGANELGEFYVGGRALGFGGAFVGLADDEQALFYNPAGLAGIEKSTFNYLSGQVIVSSDAVMTALSGSNAFTDFGMDTINELMGQNYFAHAQVTPSFVMPGFGIAAIMDGQVSIDARNKAIPDLRMGFQQTNGIQVGFAHSFGRKRRSNNEFRIGVAGKLLWRRGNYQSLGATDLFSVSPAMLTELKGSFGMGYGFDLGTQFVRKVNRQLTLSAGAAITDISGTEFSSGADPIKQNLSVGFAARYESGLTRATFAYDYRHVLDHADWRKKTHLGVELSLPMLNLYGGFNQLNLTYGVGFDAWLVNIMALTYTEELGSLRGQDPSRRWLLRFGLKFDI